MKRGIILALFILLCIPLVTAGTYDMNSFAVEPTQAFNLKVGDSLRFQMFNQTHVVIIDDISEVSVGMKFFINEEKFGYTGMRMGQTARLDINKDALSDMKIAILEIKKDADVPRATIMFESIQDLERGGDTLTGSATEVPEEQGVIKKSNKNTMAVIGIVVLGLVLFLFMRKKEDNFEEPKEEMPQETVEVEAKSAEDIKVEDTEQ